MTRRRAAVVLLLVLAFSAAGPWLSLGTTPASGALLAASEQGEPAPALLSRAAASEHLARLWRSDLGGALLADQQPHRASLATGATRTGPAPAAPPARHRRRVLARRGSRAPDEPS